MTQSVTAAPAFPFRDSLEETVEEVLTWIRSPRIPVSQGEWLAACAILTTACTVGQAAAFSPDEGIAFAPKLFAAATCLFVEDDYLPLPIAGFLYELCRHELATLRAIANSQGWDVSTIEKYLDDGNRTIVAIAPTPARTSPPIDPAILRQEFPPDIGRQLANRLTHDLLNRERPMTAASPFRAKKELPN